MLCFLPFVIKCCLTLCGPMGQSTPGSTVHGISQARILEWVSILSPKDLPNPGVKPRSSALAGRFFITVKVKVKVTQLCLTLRPCGLYSPWNSPGQNTGVGSLSFLQGIFPTQGSNPGLLNCRWVLYQLSHKGSSWATWERLMLGDCKWYQIPGSEHLLINQMKECMVQLCKQLDMGHCKTQSYTPGNPRGWPLGWGMGLIYFCLLDTHRQRIAVG